MVRYARDKDSCICSAKPRMLRCCPQLLALPWRVFGSMSYLNLGMPLEPVRVRVRGWIPPGARFHRPIVSSANPVGARLVDSRKSSIEICTNAFETNREIPIFLDIGVLFTGQNSYDRSKR